MDTNEKELVEEIEEAELPKKKLTFRDVWNEVKDIILPVVIVFVLFKFILNIFWVPSASMETTIPTKSVLLGWHLPYLLTDQSPERGEVITFRSDELGIVLVKRCIGVAGDTVSFNDGYVYVNGEKIQEPYVIEQGATFSNASYTVPEGCFFVLGDNRPGSLDARYWQNPYITNDKVIAHVFVCFSVGKTQCWQGVHFIGK